MSNLLEQWMEFEPRARKVLGGWDICRTSGIDYDLYIKQLSRVAEKTLDLGPEYRIDFKGVYLHGKNIHTLIYRVDFRGRRYSAGIARRVSLGMRDQAGDRWKEQLRKAHDIAMNQSPVALDPSLESLPFWSSSNRNKSRMTFKKDTAVLVINANKVVNASGHKDDMAAILSALSERGL